MIASGPAEKAQLLAKYPVTWEFGSHDATLMGWLTVAGYLLAAALAWRASQVARPSGPQSEQLIWLAVAAAMTLLAINKQLDLHSLVTDIGRQWAIRHDLYEQRRGLQKLMMGGVVAAGAGMMAVGWLLARGRDPALRLAFAGLAFCAGYILIRAASFHHTEIMGTAIAGRRWNWLIEWSGIALTALAGWRYRQRAQAHLR